MLYVVFSFIVDTTLLKLDDNNDRFLIYGILSIYTIVEYSIFSFFLYFAIEKKGFRAIILISVIGFFLFASIYFLTAKYAKFDSISASLESILIIIFCIFYLFDQLNKPQVMFIYQDRNFWFVAGFMLYLSGTLFLFIAATFMSKAQRDQNWPILYFANVAKNIFFALAFSRKDSIPHLQSLENPFDHSIFESPIKT